MFRERSTGGGEGKSQREGKKGGKEGKEVAEEVPTGSGTGQVSYNWSKLTRGKVYLSHSSHILRNLE